MRNVLLTTVLFTLSFFNSLMAQQSFYDKAWKKIDTLLAKEALPATAATEVQKVYLQAQKENRQDQLLKALLYKMGITEKKEEESVLKNIAFLEKEIIKMNGASRSIAQSMLAGLYWNQFQRSREQLYDRTEIKNYSPKDIATWSTQNFHQKIRSLYLASLKPEATLKKIPVAAFDAIIYKGSVRELRPTLFDLLAHNALSYFENDELDIEKPADAFEIQTAAAFDPAADFAYRKFPTSDSSSPHHTALLLYQKLIAFHLLDKKNDALVDADLARLKFVRTYAVQDDKDERYLASIQHIAQQYGQTNAAHEARALIAQYYFDEEENRDQTDNTLWLVKAREVCEQVLQSKDSTSATVSCRNLLNRILTKEIQLQTDLVNLPGKPFLVSIEYRNAPTLYVRLIHLTPEIRASLKRKNEDEESYWKKIAALPASKNWHWSLPLVADHRKHRVEAAVPALPVGDYALLSSTTPDFEPGSGPLQFTRFHISSLAYFSSENRYYVVHRETGLPMGRTNVQVWYRGYDQLLQQYTERKGENLFTDKNGFFTIPWAKTPGNSNIRIELTSTDDHLFLDQEQYLPFQYRNTSNNSRSITYLFTDRSIYRPGQTVYFKGLVISSKENENSRSQIVVGQKVTLTLHDVNGELIDSFYATTSDYGTYSGKFNLPLHKLNGQFSIRDKQQGYLSVISVEEYKRPRFEVTLDAPDGTYKLNQKILVPGEAKAFAGNAIGGAKLSYKVTRTASLPDWIYESGMMRSWPPFRDKETIIATGELKTGADGKFEIPFTAVPDEKIPSKQKPVFSYTVAVDITDINGETQSASTMVNIGYHGLDIALILPASEEASAFTKLYVKTTNLNNKFEPTAVTIQLRALQQPSRLFRKRNWEKPDQFMMTREEFYQQFPLDIYNNEDEPENWTKKEVVLEFSDSTNASGALSLPQKTIPEGWYEVVASCKDQQGESYQVKKIIQLTGASNTEVLLTADLQLSKQVVEPAEEVNLTIRSNIDSIWALHLVEKNGSEATTSLQTEKKGNRHVRIIPTEADRGGILHKLYFVRYNRFFERHTKVIVPFTNKELKITYETYRDKTLPGAEEKWKVKISGYKADKVAAEYLTAMYDASLDQFTNHRWNTPFIYNHTPGKVIYRKGPGFETSSSDQLEKLEEEGFFYKEYDRFYFANNEGTFWWLDNGMGRIRVISQMGSKDEEVVSYFSQSKSIMAVSKNAAPVARELDVNDGIDDAKVDTARAEIQQNTSNIPLRKNFNETAFFIPELHTDSNGVIEFSFTMPEALTKWKWMSLAHTKDLAFGYSEKDILTQKELMLQPNPPRFLREGDRMDFTTKIVNMTDKELTGQVELQWIDPTTNQPVDGWFRNFFPNQYFTVPAHGSVPASFTIEVPFQYNRPVTYRLIARSGTVSDGEEMTLPVVSNRQLVTESISLNLRGTQAKEFRFDNLLKSGASESLNHHAFTIEMTSNPVWYAVQALPYLMEYPYECAEQTFNRYYANALATKIARSNPKIKAVFDKWVKAAGTNKEALLSKLQQNEELKSVLLQETPWVMEAKSEAEQKKNIALLFDLVRMSREMDSYIDKLSALQTAQGAFPWFAGGPNNRYITQYIVTGLGHLKKLGALEHPKANVLLKQALAYLDGEIVKEYKERRKKQPATTAYQLAGYDIQYLYMRSFFTDEPIPGALLAPYQAMRQQAMTYWAKESKYLQGMIALSLFRTGEVKVANDILRSLKQNALYSEEMGMYWKEFTSGGYYWHNAPVESQALLIEAFDEISKDAKTTDGLKTWLLKQKQTSRWSSTRSTAEAVYALLLGGSNWLQVEQTVSVMAGNTVLQPSETEAGTGYFKQSVDPKFIKPETGTIKVVVQSKETNTVPVWGAAYWQYFEELDKIKSAATGININKKLFVRKNTSKGTVLETLKEGGSLKVGDRITVRIEIRSDRDLEFVHLKDMRGACMEPVNTLSGYKWKGGLGYYESTKDASTNFFFDRIAKGTYVFEYDLFVTHSGTFSNGITSMQCMYAPEFTSHSEGIKVNVDE